MNQRKTDYPTSSMFKGVSDNLRDKWAVQLTLNGQKTFLGRFASETDAARAYDRAALQYFGEYAYINFPHVMSDVEA
jgi:AP2-like factor, euAP2 lineage